MRAVDRDALVIARDELDAAIVKLTFRAASIRLRDRRWARAHRDAAYLLVDLKREVERRLQEAA